MRHQIELHAHNGNTGENHVEPFAGEVIEIDCHTFDKELPLRNGRRFTLAYVTQTPEVKTGVYREKVETKPSEWALAQGKA